MFKKLIMNGKETDLFYHITEGGAEYLTDKFVESETGHKEGVFNEANVIIRIDGGELEFIVF